MKNYDSFLIKTKILDMDFCDLVNFTFFHLKEENLVIRYDDEGNLYFAKADDTSPKSWIKHKFSLHEGFELVKINNEYVKTSNFDKILNFIEQNNKNFTIECIDNIYHITDKINSIRSKSLLEGLLRLKLIGIYGDYINYPIKYLDDNLAKEFSSFQIHPIFGPVY